MPRYTVEATDEGTLWYKEGTAILHRENGPAYENANGAKFWYQNNQLHRLDGPAIEYKDGSKFWYQNGLSHRLDGPAFEYADGRKEWYQNGQLHREDGPAIERLSGRKEYYINGQQLTFEEFDRRTQVQELSVAEIEQLLGYKVKVVDK